MKNKIYYLSTCDTCKKILKDINADKHGFDMQDIKPHPLSEMQVDALARRAGSYEALINKRAILWKERKLAEKNLTEKDFRQLLLEHYTFLKRPVIDYKGRLFTNSDKKLMEALKEELG